MNGHIAQGFRFPQPDLTIGDTGDVEPTQSFDLSEDLHGAVDYRVRATKFSQVNSIAFYFSTGLDEMKLNWLGLRGEASCSKRRAVDTIYEVLCDPRDCTSHGHNGDGIL